MKYISFFCFFLLFTLQLSAQKRQAKKPNIILFLVDDMGWQDTSVPFYKEITANNRKYNTPNMERLAKMGIKFTNAYATSVCTPTRVSLMSGMSIARHHVTNWTNGIPDKPTDAPYPGLKWPDWNYNGMSPVKGINNTVYVTPMPEILKQNGYYTIHTGKGHFSAYNSPASNPSNIGFIKNIAGNADGSPGSYLGKDNFGDKKGGFTPTKESKGLEAYYGKDIFLSEALTLETIKTLDTAASSGKPFFLYMSHYAVHIPYKPDNRFYQKYIDKGYSRNEAMYASIVEGMDKSLGDLMDYVERKEIADNTIILFMSDNGGLALTPPRDGEMYFQNAPLRSGKGSLYEGGIREPMLAYWPGITKAGSVNNQYLIIEDFFPTILEMAGVKNYETVQTIDGKSFIPFLKSNSKTDTSRALVWHFPSSWEQGDQTIKKQSKGMRVEQQGMGPASAIRKGNWKLIYFYGTAETELYDLKNDIGEHKNLVKQYPAVVRGLTEILYQKLKETNAQFPVSMSTGKNIYPGAEKEITRIN